MSFGGKSDASWSQCVAVGLAVRFLFFRASALQHQSQVHLCVLTQSVWLKIDSACLRNLMVSLHEKELAIQLKACSEGSMQLAAQIRKQKDVLRNRARKQEAKKSRLIQVGLRIVLIATHAVMAVERWLQMKMPASDDPERHALRDNILDKFNAMTVTDINAMLEPLAKQDIALLKEAQAESAKYSLYEWVCEQNTIKGVAPSVSAIIKQKLRREPLASEEDSVPAASTRTKWAEYKWISKWTRKWKMPKGIIHDRDTPGPGQLRDKVQAHSTSSLKQALLSLHVHYKDTLRIEEL